MDLIDHLQTLATRAEQLGPNLTNEEATKMALIAPFIQALGYDIFNPAEVMPEFRADLPGINQGERVDYAILENSKPTILVEAKPFTANLTAFLLRNVLISPLASASSLPSGGSSTMPLPSVNIN